MPRPEVISILRTNEGDSHRIAGETLLMLCHERIDPELKDGTQRGNFWTVSLPHPLKKNMVITIEFAAQDPQEISLEEIPLGFTNLLASYGSGQARSIWLSRAKILLPSHLSHPKAPILLPLNGRGEKFDLEDAQAFLVLAAIRALQDEKTPVTVTQIPERDRQKALRIDPWA